MTDIAVAQPGLSLVKVHFILTEAEKEGEGEEGERETVGGRCIARELRTTVSF